jgi:inosose dehydratase
MRTQITRRRFVRTSAMAAGSLALAGLPRSLAALAPGDIRFGYAAITWEGKDKDAITDIAAVGFKGIQLRTSVLSEFGDKPAALKELLARHGLTMVAFSSGGARIAPEAEADDFAIHTKHARFVRDVGGLSLQLTDSRPKRALVAADYTRLGRHLTEIGKRTADVGVPVAYHPHMNAIGERPEEVDRVLEAADPRYVKVLLDVAHYYQGGGDPVKAIRKYADRLLLLHLKDVESPLPGNTGDPMRSYRFVELGRGKMDLPAVFAALNDVAFKGWAVVELDAVPDKARSAKASAEIAKQFIEKLGHKI